MTELRAADGRPIVAYGTEPEFFIQKVALIEPLGDENFRVFCCTVIGEEYRLQYVVVMPASMMLANTLAVRDIAREIIAKERKDVH